MQATLDGKLLFVFQKFKDLRLSLEDDSKDNDFSTLFIFGKAELKDVRSLTEQQRVRYLKYMVTKKVSIVIVADQLDPVKRVSRTLPAAENLTLI